MGGPLGGLILKPTAVVNKAAVFDGATYGDLGIQTDFNISYIEIDVTFISTANLRQTIFANFSSSPIAGWYFRLETVGRATLYRFSGGIIVGRIDADVLTWTVDEKIKLGIKAYGTVGKVFVDDVETQDLVVDDVTIDPNTLFPSQIGVRNNVFNEFEGIMFGLNIWELDMSGNRIKHLVKIDYNNGDETSVPNIGADAPVDSDLIWVPADGGTYVNV